MGKIKKVLLSGAFFLFCACNLSPLVNAEELPAELAWSRTYNSGAGIFDIAWDVATDAQNSVVISGISIDSAKPGFNQNDTRIIKFNSDGDILWNKVFDSGANDAGYAVAVDTGNNIYAAGFVAPPGDPYQGDCRVLKLTAKGEIIWDKTFSLRQGKTDCYDMSVYSFTEIYIAGTLGDVSYSTMTADAFLLKIDNNGDMKWAKVTDNGRMDLADVLAVDKYGNPIIGGSSHILLNGPGGPVRQIFTAAKASPYGATVFSNSYRAGLDDAYGSVTGLDTDKDGNILIGGAWATMTQEGTLYVKVSASGEEIIKKFTPRPSWMSYFAPYGGAAADKSGNLYLAGYSYGNWQTDMAFSKISTEGSLLWSQKLEQDGGGYANSLALDNNGDVYITGLSYTFEGIGSMTLAKYRSSAPLRKYSIIKFAPLEPHLADINVYSESLVSLVKDAEGNPGESVALTFNISKFPDFAVGQELTKTSGITNSQGVADVFLKIGNIPAEYSVTAKCESCAPESSSVTFTCCGKLPNDHFSQSGQSWSSDCYANNNCRFTPNATIGWRGCALTSLATLINYYNANVYPGIPRTNPGDLNTYLRGLPGFYGYTPENDVNFEAIEIYSGGRVSFVDRYDVSRYSSREVLLDMADGLIRSGIPLIFRIGDHFVAVIGKCGDNFVVADPAGGQERLYDPANPQGRPFRGLRVFSNY